MKDIRLVHNGALKFSAPPGAEGGPRRFEMLAYTGQMMDVGFGSPVVIDMKGIKLGAQCKPILLNHDPLKIVGHSDKCRVDAKGLCLEGSVSASTPAGLEVAQLADEGFPWQASINVTPTKTRRVEAGESVKCNGMECAGPLQLILKSVLRESSFCPMGADGDTKSVVFHAGQDEGDAMMDNDEKPQGQHNNIIPLSDALTAGDVRKHAPGVYAQIGVEAVQADSARRDTIRGMVTASALPASVQAALVSSCSRMQIAEAQTEITRLATIEASLSAAVMAGMQPADIDALRTDVSGLTANIAQATIKTAVDIRKGIQARMNPTADPVLTTPATPQADAVLDTVRPFVVEARAKLKHISAKIPEKDYVRSYVGVATSGEGKTRVELTEEQLVKLMA